MTNDLITIKDLRKSKMCSAGAREFCKKHNIDWNRFLDEGIPVSEVAHIDDAMMKQVIKEVLNNGR